VQATYPLIFAALLFCVGIYGVLSRRNAVLVLMSVEMMLAAVTINLVAFGEIARAGDPLLTGQVFALFVIAVAAAEVGVGLAIILLIYRNRTTIDLESASLMKG
jgi:NADH:ubiquinone oxidoreductase subunit K